jgi:hypothetical protein
MVGVHHHHHHHHQNDDPMAVPGWRRWYVLVAALITLLGVVAFGDDGDAGGPADRPAVSSTTKGALADRGLEATVRYRATDRSPAGTVVSQSRTSGAGVAPGRGNGPEYVDGPVRVHPPDPFDLDREGDGWELRIGVTGRRPQAVGQTGSRSASSLGRVM